MQGNLLRRAGLASTYARGPWCGHWQRFDIAGSLHGSVGDKPTKLIASSRGRWCDFFTATAKATTTATFLSCRPPPPPIDALGDLTKATESTNGCLLRSPSLLSYARSYAASRKGAEIPESARRREQRDSPRARIQRLLRGAIARKTRVFHTFLLVFGSRISPEQRAKSNERARGREGDRRDSRRRRALSRDDTLPYSA